MWPLASHRFDCLYSQRLCFRLSLVELLLLLTSVVIRLLICDSRHASALAELSLLIWARPISIYMLMYSSCLRLEHQCYVPFPVRPVPWGGTRQPSSYYCGVGCFGDRVIHPVCVWIPLGTSPLGRRRHAGLLGRVLYPCIRASQRCHIRLGTCFSAWPFTSPKLTTRFTSAASRICFRMVAFLLGQTTIRRGVDFFHDAAPGFLVPAGI